MCLGRIYRVLGQWYVSLDRGFERLFLKSQAIFCNDVVQTVQFDLPSQLTRPFKHFVRVVQDDPFGELKRDLFGVGKHPSDKGFGVGCAHFDDRPSVH